MFDFLFSNPIIIIILIAVISSLFKKKRKPNSQKLGQPQTPKPLWKEVIQEFKEALEEEKKKTPKTIQAEPNMEFPNSNQKDEDEETKRMAELKRLQQEYDEKQHQETGSETTAQPVLLPSSTIPVARKNTISDKRSPIYNKEISFGKQELINGIMMSEILSPPRAKRSKK